MISLFQQEELVKMKNKPYGFIYMTTNHVNGKKYIGQRKYYGKWRTYLGSGKALKDAIKKYGKENFSKEILEDCFSKEELNEREIYWIKHYDAVKNKDFYNMRDGGEGGGNYLQSYTEEQRAKTLKKRSISLKKAKKNMEIQNGRKVICLNTMKIYNSIAEASRDVNVPQSSIQQCCSDANENHNSAGFDKKTGERLQWKYYEDGKSYEYIPFKSLTFKKVICVNTGEIFNSVKEATEKYKASDISRCCNGKLKTSGKHPITGERLVWKYYDDQIKTNIKTKSVV